MAVLVELGSAGRRTGARGLTAARAVADAVALVQGAEEAGNTAELVRIVRDQIKHGADWVKIYADYRWGPDGEARPGFQTPVGLFGAGFAETVADTTITDL